MKKRLYTWIFGEQKIRFHIRDATYVMNFLLQHSVYFQGYTTAEDFATLSCKREDRKLLSSLSERGHFSLLPEKGGAFRFLKRVRPGVAVGAFLAAGILFLSGLFVWDIRVTGTAGMDDDRVVSALSEAGLRIGSFIPTANFDRVENTFLQASDDIGWIHIYMQGSIAMVEVIEKTEPPLNDEKRSAVNLVADCDAVITEIAVSKGKSVVKRGSVVKKGDLLVSGILTGVDTTEFVTASGKVYGECKRSFSAEIPLTYQKKIKESEKIRNIRINFFGYPINIYEDTGNLDASYDTIYRRSNLSFFGLFPLPIVVEETVFLTYRTEECRLSPIEAIRAAERTLRAESATLLAESELLSRKLVGAFRDDAYVLQLEILCITDITKPLPITLESE